MVKSPLLLVSELYTLLLEDILVLLQKQDERLVLKCHSKNLSGTADTKHIFSPIIKLNAVLVRSVATGELPYRCNHIISFPDKDGRPVVMLPWNANIHSSVLLKCVC